ncbi:MAG: PilN domain-containing protein [Planctomycetota bacterium]
MKGLTGTIQGLTVGRDRITLAEAQPGKQGASARQRVELPLDEGAGLEQPEALGAALAERMKQQGIRPGRVALGLSTRWVLASARTLPPISDDALVGAVRLQIERDYAGGRDELVFDYTEPTPPNGSRQLVLIGTQRKRLDLAEHVARASGLTVVQAMPTGLALAQSVCVNGPGTQDALCIVLEDDGAALVQLKQGRCHGLVSCAFDPFKVDASDNTSAPWAIALQQNLAALQADNAAVHLIVATALSDEQVSAVQRSLVAGSGPVNTTRADPAAAVAQAAQAEPATINFTRPRLAEKKKRALPPAAVWGIRAAVLALLVCGTVGYFWFEATSRLQQLEDNYAVIADQAKELEQMNRDTRAVAGWYDQRPAVMDCLLELTRTFPRRGRIWVTSLSIDADASGTLNCKAQDEATMFAYVNAMKRSPRLAEVQLQGSRDADREGTTVSFEVTFRYVSSADALAGGEAAPQTRGGEG